MTGVPVVLVVEHEAGCPPGRLAAPLLAGGATLDLRRPWRGETLPTGPDALHGVDALLVLGGRVAAWDDDAAPWLPATRRLLAAAARDGVPALGVCLGAQLLALATGGRVERGAAGEEAGLLAVTALPAGEADPLLGAVVAALGTTWRAPQAHGDAVVELPPDAELLASSSSYPVQALRVGERAWGVQYHPEVTPGVFAGWLGHHEAALAARGTTAAEQLLAVADAEPALALLADVHGRHLAAAAGERAAGAVGAVGTAS